MTIKAKLEQVHRSYLDYIEKVCENYGELCDITDIKRAVKQIELIENELKEIK